MKTAANRLTRSKVNLSVAVPFFRYFWLRSTSKTAAIKLRLAPS